VTYQALFKVGYLFILFLYVREPLLQLFLEFLGLLPGPFKFAFKFKDIFFLVYFFA